MIKHLAIFSGNTAEEILNGRKTIESRFSKSKIAPFGVVSAGDLVYLKPSGREIIGQFMVKKVIFFDGLTLEDLDGLKKEYGIEIAADEKYWDSKKDCRFGTLIFIGDSTRFITSPFKLQKRDLRGWVVLD